ncbi:MAG: hypothetical protein J6M18_01830 [Actinomycetaceae bacterium]|nr:hypothetical protein [Actinomycetaceae bacterium]
MARAKNSKVYVGDIPRIINDACLVPFTLIKAGEAEDFFAQQIIDKIRALAKEVSPLLEETILDASTYQAGSLFQIASPSLFSDARFIYIHSCEAMNNEFLTDALTYCSQPAHDIYVIFHHGGGVRGKKLLDTLAKNSAQIITMPTIKTDNDKVSVLQQYVRSMHRGISPSAAFQLVGAYGNVPELIGVARQLLHDTDSDITDELVYEYCRGRNEATGFDVADAALNGDTARALLLMRQSVATGTHPLVIVSALTSKARTLALVMGNFSYWDDVVTEEEKKKILQMSPWAENKARQECMYWSLSSLSHVFVVLSQADSLIKGGGREPIYALEQALMEITQARRES